MGLKGKLSDAWKKAKKAARNAFDALLLIAATCMLVGGIGVLAAQAPNLHKKWLRKNVGSEVYMIVARDAAGKQLGGGTGFHVTARSGVTYMLTNAHVCEGVEENGSVWVKQEGERYLPRKVIEISEYTDLCLVEALPGHEGLKLASSSGPGRTLNIVGHPLLMPLSISTGETIARMQLEFPYADLVPSEEEADGKFALTEKQCAAKPKYKVMEIEDPWFGGKFKVCALSLSVLQTTIISYPGNSGSPAVNFWGEVEGVLYAGTGRTNYGFLIPLDHIEAFLAPY